MEHDLLSPRPPWRPSALARRLRRFIGDVAREYREDGVSDLAAAITFWTLLSVPAAALSLVSTLSSLGSLIGESLAADVRREVESFVARTFTENAPINDTVADLFDTSNTGVATVATLVAVFTLSRAFAGLIRALDHAYEIVERRPWWYVRLVAIGLGLGTIVIVAAATTFFALLPDLPGVPGWSTAPVVFLGLVMWAATVFHIGPNHRTPWRYDLPGAVFTATGWVVATQGFAWYVRLFPGENDLQTSVGAVLLALTLMYLLSIILLVGAQINDVLARRAGVVRRPTTITDRARSATRRWSRG